MKNYEKSYEQIMEETERKSRRETELVSKEIIQELELCVGIHFPVEQYRITYASCIQAILLDPKYEEYRYILLCLMQNHDYNEKNLLFRLISILNQPSLNQPKNKITKELLENSFSKLPCIKSMQTLGIGYHIDTDYGTIHVFQLNKMNKMSCNIEKSLQGCCHEVVDFYHNEFLEDTIVTSAMPNLFTGKYYHSYFEMSDGSGVADIANNAFYLQNDFQNMFEPTIVNQIPCDKIEDYYQDFKEENICIPKKNRVLQMAISKVNHK